ncbi:MAG TPA: acetyl-CoA carboxylase biotin carboxyl carrier protein, partial [Kofleriaceae bacterium]|nr:acetyl-CoA carboxylase biotin carboxyl carrier protein [Kofleriaceae bacterium]
RRGGMGAMVPAQQMTYQMPMAPMGAPAPAPGAAGAPGGAAAAAPVVDDKSHVVTSPFVGTFYRKPNPDSSPYVSIGDRVQKGQVLCIVEAMKLMNEIEADTAGTITAILVEDNQPVEYGQPLFKIAP